MPLVDGRRAACPARIISAAIKVVFPFPASRLSRFFRRGNSAGRCYRHVNRFPIGPPAATPCPTETAPDDKLFSCARSRRHELFQRLLEPGDSQGRSRCLAGRRTGVGGRRRGWKGVRHSARQKASAKKILIRENIDCLRSERIFEITRVRRATQETCISIGRSLGDRATRRSPPIVSATICE